MLPRGLERVVVFEDALGNAVLGAMSRGRYLFGRCLGPDERTGAYEDACTVLDDGPGVYMGPSEIARYAASHGPVGYVSDEGVFAYGKGAPYLSVGQRPGPDGQGG